MKTVTAAARAHLDKTVTNLCTCIIIEREDGVTQYFTDHDENIVVDGDTYLSIGAYKRTAITSVDNLAVDNLDIEGIADSLVLPRESMLVGVYDYAKISIFATQWNAASPDKIKLRTGFFGQVQVLPNGTFTVELRGLLQKLSHTFTQTYAAACLNDLGDRYCKIPVEKNWLATGTYAVDDYVSAPYIGSTHHLVINDPYFAAGSIASSTGWYKLAVAEITLTGVLTTGDTITVDDGVNPPIALVADTDFTVGVSATADLAALAGAISLAAPLRVSVFVSAADVLYIRNDTTNDGSVVATVDVGGVVTIVDFLDSDITVTDTTTATIPTTGPMQGTYCAKGGSGTGTIANDIDILRTGVSLASIDAGSCELDLWYWLLGADNAAIVSCEAFDSDMTSLGYVYSSGQLDVIVSNEWKGYGTHAVQIPPTTRILRLTFTAVLTGTPPINQYFDNIYGWITDTSVSVPQYAPYNDLLWKCTGGGTVTSPITNGTLPLGQIDAETYILGTPTLAFVSEEGWTKGATVISVTEGSSRVFRAEPQDYRAVSGWYDGGLVHFHTGKNAGAKMEIKSWVRDGTPTKEMMRVVFDRGLTEGPYESGGHMNIIDWNRNVVYVADDVAGFGNLTYLMEYDLSSLSYNGVIHDLTYDATDLELNCIDPTTGYLHGMGESGYYLVYDPATTTYVTATLITTEDVLQERPMCVLTNGVHKKVLHTSIYKVFIHNYNDFNILTTWDGPNASNPSSPFYGGTNFVSPNWDDTTRTFVSFVSDTETRIYEIYLDSGGTVTTTYRGSVYVWELNPTPGAAFIGASTTCFYDPTHRMVLFETSTFSTSPTVFRGWTVGFDLSSGTIRWRHEYDNYWDGYGLTGHNVRLDGRRFGVYEVSQDYYTIIDIATGKKEFRSLGYNPGLYLTSFGLGMWDGHNDCMYFSSDTFDVAPTYTQNLIRTCYPIQTIAPGTVELMLSLPHPIEPGDLFTITAGCDKSRVYCAVIFDNVDNMIAAPDIPGVDNVMRYPDAKS